MLPGPLLAALASSSTSLCSALGTVVVLYGTPPDEASMSVLMSLAIGLMFSAVVGLYNESLEDAGKSCALGPKWKWVPVVVGGFFATLMLWALDELANRYLGSGKNPHRGRIVVHVAEEMKGEDGWQHVKEDSEQYDPSPPRSFKMQELEDRSESPYGPGVITPHPHPDPGGEEEEGGVGRPASVSVNSSRLILFALSVQNIPEGLSLGMAWGNAAKAEGNDLKSAFPLTVAMGLQAVPEGAATALVLLRMGYSQKSALIVACVIAILEPLSALFGALTLMLVSSLAPYAIAFAASCMLFVVVKDLVPDVMATGKTPITSAIYIMIGFNIMIVGESLSQLVGETETGSGNC